MPPPQKDDEKKGEEPPKDPPNKPADDSSAGKLVWLAAGAALMWLGGALHDAFNTDEQQKERANSYKQRKRVSSAWPDNNTSSSCANAALRGANAPGNTLDAPSNLASSGAIGLGADERTIPSFLCPITHEIMQDPVTTPYGHSYERAALLRFVLSC
jgi:hypothetical protein